MFVVPEIAVPTMAARVMDLADPGRKMGKSHEDGSGIVYLLDPPDVVRRKVQRAVTDSDTGAGAVRRSADKPGVTNLLDILEACAGPGAAAGLTTYGALKVAVTDAVVATLEPVQRRYAALAADPDAVDEVYRRGAERCRELTRPVLAAARAAMGLGCGGSSG